MHKLATQETENRTGLARGSSKEPRGQIALPGSISPGTSGLLRKASCACGGGCPACGSRNGDLKVSKPNDPAEVEADRTADIVMRMADPESGTPFPVQAGAVEGTQLQRLAKKGATGDTALRGSLGDGVPLETAVRDFFEPRFGYDFGSVRLHKGPGADAAAAGVRARAFTLGNNLVFRSGTYDPGSNEGRRLLAHELTHVVQQTGGSRNGTKRSSAGSLRGKKDSAISAVGKRSVQRSPEGPPERHAPVQINERQANTGLIVQRDLGDIEDPDPDWGRTTARRELGRIIGSMRYVQVQTDCPPATGIRLADILLQLRGRIEGNTACAAFFRDHFGDDPVSILTRYRGVSFTVDSTLTGSSGHVRCPATPRGGDLPQAPLVRINPGLCTSPHIYRVLLHELAHVSDCYGGRGESWGEVRADEAADVCIGTVRQQLDDRDAAAAAATAAEDWNFTAVDMLSLQQRASTLRFGSDSSWFPSSLRANLRNTLLYLLVPRTDAPRTEAVNTTDFFHGHVVVPAGAETPSLLGQRGAYSTATGRMRERTLGPGLRAPVTASNLGAFRAGLSEMTDASTPLLSAAILIPGAAVIYHTFEFPRPGTAASRIRAGSPQRNFLTPVATNSPAPYTQPDIDNASSYSLGPDAPYTHIFQFSFLIDRNGVIHVRPDFVRELSDVVGAPLNPPSLGR